MNKLIFIGAVGLISMTFFAGSASGKPKLPSGWEVHDMTRPLPTVVAAGATDAQPPSDAIVLFDGSGFDEWNGKNGDVKWTLENGYMEVTPTGGISTKRTFGDCQLHIEWATPNPPAEKAQRRGNSGVFLMGYYEIQIMDGWENTAYADGMAGAVYGQTPALVNVCKKPGAWQSYDIVFTAPVFKDQELVSPGRVTVFQNGVLVQNNTEIYGATQHNVLPKAVVHGPKGPLVLQNHGQPVRFRTIWIRSL